ncbi:MAG: hypothetical protein JXA30_15535 [Deltaproteobacteria bacterium]|nr:hypothetical protein [Deltaproteobacteria bacterium]
MKNNSSRCFVYAALTLSTLWMGCDADARNLSDSGSGTAISKEDEDSSTTTVEDSNTTAEVSPSDGAIAVVDTRAVAATEKATFALG